MHPALQIFDIVDHIFFHLRIDPPEDDRALGAWDRQIRGSRRALFQSALCCRGFLDAALKHLWWNQDRVTNVLKLVPGFLFCDQKKKWVSNPNWTYMQVMYPKQAFNLPLKEEHWRKPDSYAILVKTFIHPRCTPDYDRDINHDIDRDRVDVGLFTQILETRKNRPLFPNLRRVYSDSRPETIFLLVSSSLRHLAINPWTPTFQLASLWVGELPRFARGISSLCLRARIPASDLRHIYQLEQLQHLTLQINWSPKEISHAYYLDYLRGLAVLPQLRSLTIFCFRGHMEQIGEPLSLPSPLPESFASLQGLDFNGPLQGLAEILPLLRTDKLISLSGDLKPWTSDEQEKNPTENIFLELCNTLVKHSLGSLRRLSLCGIVLNFKSFQYFQPLLELQKIETVKFGKTDHFGDNSLIKLAAAWPELVTLDVECYGIKLFAVKELLEFCPKLRVLSLPLNARSMDGILNIPTTAPLRHGLREWNIHPCLVTEETLRHVLEVMKWFFPKVDKIDSWRRGSGTGSRVSLMQVIRDSTKFALYRRNRAMTH